MSATKINPSVDVVWWNDSYLYIHCPYCEELHYHAFMSYESDLRVPHCGFFNRPSYRYNFPVAYEIDKIKARFVNICTLQYMEEDSEDETSLSGEFSNMNLSSTASESHQREILFDDSTETITINSEGRGLWVQRRISFALSDCVTGNLSEVKNYLETSCDKSIFLHGKDRNGDTCLVMASQEKSSSMVSLLIDYGAEVNATNKNGRTALMEASLWGRLESAKILLSRGADRYLSDSKNKRAFDLAQSTRQNQKERHTKAGGIWCDPCTEPWYKEDVVNRDADRREIARILEGAKPHISTEHQPQETEATYHSFRRSPDGQSIVHCGPIREYPVSRPNKTIAILQRGSPFPAIAAMSGWGHSERASTTVSGKDWTKRVFEIAAIVGHTLSADSQKDKGAQGKFQASHAEKQLIAYFLDRHVFLPEDRIPNPRFDDEIARLESEIEEMAFHHPSIPQLCQLRKEKRELERELFDKDDRLLGEEYDERLVEQLKMNIANLNEQGVSLEKLSEVKEVRAREFQIEECENGAKIHGRVNRISQMAPKNTLSQATILISTPRYEICKDCLLFKDRVNRFFGLSIELHECTK